MYVDVRLQRSSDYPVFLSTVTHGVCTSDVVRLERMLDYRGAGLQTVSFVCVLQYIYIRTYVRMCCMFILCTYLYICIYIHMSVQCKGCLIEATVV